MTAPDRLQTSFRYRRNTLRAVDEVRALFGGLSREDMLQLLLLRGLAVTYRELGIKRDPADTAAELLAVLTRTWGGDLSDSEAAAFGMTGAALERIVQVRARDGDGEVRRA